MRHFKIEEFDCSETGENDMDDEFLHKLDDLRELLGFPFVVTSGFRSVKHSKEIVKEAPGWHTRGKAADIRVSSGMARFRLVQAAIEHGFTGIGVAKTFIHLDTRDTPSVMWTYS
jgi:uncharacterized protein YcbK (DUF882 family)